MMKRLLAWLRGERTSDLERYLSDAQNPADLERREREWQRQQGFWRLPERDERNSIDRRRACR